MTSQPATLRAWLRAIAGLPVILFLLAHLCLLSACQGDGTQPTPAADSRTQEPPVTAGARPEGRRDAPLLALSIKADETELAPTPLRAGYPFTITAMIHNDSPVNATSVPLLVHLSANQEQLGYTSFVEVISVTVPASETVSINVPVQWNLAGGEHRLWMQVNRVPDAWQSRAPTQPEENLADNLVLLDLMIDPFDAYTSDLCPGRVDVEVGPLDVLPDPEKQQVLVQIHNLGNRAVYNLPVIILSGKASGMAYSPVIPPCGGTARMQVSLDQPLVKGESFSVRVNPEGWEDALLEEDYANNEVTVAAALPGAAEQQFGRLHDYDFSISAAEIEVPQESVVLIRVYNHGTRDAADVPVRVSNQAGLKINDVVPLVQGGGSGVVAIRVASLWKSGSTLTFTVNAEDASAGYPETNRQNNIATFVVP